MHADEAITLCPTAVWGASTATTVAGSSSGLPGSTLNMLRLPWAVFVDNTSTVYVSDWANNRVQKWLANATNGTTVAGGNPGIALNQLTDPRGISVDANGHVYVVDSINARVMKWAPNSTANANGTIVAGGNGTGSGVNQLNYPDGLFVESETGIVWIADTNNHRIVKWLSPSAGSVVCGSYGSGLKEFAFPRGLFVDTSASNTLYVADTGNHRIQKWLSGASSGTTVAGQPHISGNALNQLYNPQAVIVDFNGNIFIADTFNNRIMLWRNGDITGSVVVDSSTAPSQLNGPQSLSLYPDEAIAVADSFNMRVQKFVLSCPTTTTTTTTTSTTTTTTSITMITIITTTTMTTMTTMTTTTAMTATTATTTTPLLHGYWNTTGVTIAGGYGSNASQLNYPLDVAIDSNNYLYVADFNNCRIQRWLVGNLTGVTVAGTTSVCGSNANQLRAPTCVFVHSNGALYISDSSNTRIQRWTNGASSGTTVATNIISYGVYVDSSGTLYASDWNNHQVLRWPGSGGITNVIIAGGNGPGSASNQLSSPKGIYVDSSSSYVYVADTFNHRIQRWSIGDSTVSTVCGGNGLGLGMHQLSNPSSVLVDNSGYIYVSDSGNNRIVQWGPSATYGVLLVGSYGSQASQFSTPYGIKFDSNWNLYVADSGNSRIQKFYNQQSPSTSAATGTF
ncbi:unnamed protein product [Rotaria sp. Silwood2]|nr:unnamed protein product [Rotaria sp. Silwood2]